MNQNHLKKKDMINLGSYYTDLKFIDIVWDFIKPFLTSNSIIFDTSCGYGNFFKDGVENIQIGSDIDNIAIRVAKKRFKNVRFFNKNSLININRKDFNIPNNKKLFIIGNPPYNDTTSLLKSNIKENNFNIDERVKTRDLGISFLKSYYYLNADYIAVLHPLSYLIKKANFNLLKEFKDNYKLVKGVVISSGEFLNLNKNTPFPILISLYKKDSGGMDYEYIEKFKFNIFNTDKTFSISDFDYIDNYVEKYPNKKPLTKKAVLFHTLRDINALKRNQTFMQKPSYNSVNIDLKKIDYYMYIDTFKYWIHKIPYYLGNSPIIIDKELFDEYRDYFIIFSLNNNHFLKKKLPLKNKYKKYNIDIVREKIDYYFKTILKNHYEN